MADAADSKSAGVNHCKGSSPFRGTNQLTYRLLLPSSPLEVFFDYNGFDYNGIAARNIQ